jgi:hypothetical protein
MSIRGLSPATTRHPRRVLISGQKHAAGELLVALMTAVERIPKAPTHPEGPQCPSWHGRAATANNNCYDFGGRGLIV